MPTNSAVKGQKILQTFGPENHIRTVVEHSGPSGSSFDVDQSADSVLSVRHKDGGTAPTATLGSASNGLKTITLSGGTTGRVEVITLHLGRIGGFQPAQSTSESG
jgi:hypothetical protein